MFRNTLDNSLGSSNLLEQSLSNCKLGVMFGQNTVMLLKYVPVFFVCPV